MTTATVICDASLHVSPRGKISAGWAAWVRVDNVPYPIKGYGSIVSQDMRDSFHAETLASLNGAWLAKRYGAESALIQTDCMTLVHVICGVVRSKPILTFWRSSLEKANLLGFPLSARHVKGHGPVVDVRTYLNDWCDRHARRGMFAARDNQRVTNIYEGDNGPIQLGS